MSMANVDDIPAGEHIVKDLFFFHMIEHGFYVARRGFIVLSLPLSDQQLDRFHAAFEAFLKRFGEGLVR